MFKKIALLILLINISTLSIVNSYAATPNLTIYPNYVNTVEDFDISMVKPISNTVNADLSLNRLNVLFFYDENVAILKQKTANLFNPDLIANPEYIFGYEPYKSNKDRINFWYMDKPLNLSYGTATGDAKTAIVDAAVKIITDKLILQGLPNLSGITMLNKSLTGGRSSAYYAKIEYSPDYSSILSYEPADFHLYYDVDSTSKEISIPYLEMIHEMGHSIMALKDEYIEPGKTIPNFGYPNCAETEAQAKLWWGDAIGKVDPEFYPIRDTKVKLMIAENAANGSGYLDYQYVNGVLHQYRTVTDIDPVTLLVTNSIEDTIYDLNQVLNEEDYRVKLTNNMGCYAEAGFSYRPTTSSMMNKNDTNIFGVVNSRVGDKILKQFSSTPLAASKVIIPDSLKFEKNALSNAKCTVTEKAGRQILDCIYQYQKTTTSPKIKYGYVIVDGVSGALPAVDKSAINNPCTAEPSGLVIKCTGIDITNLTPDKLYSIALIADSNDLYGNTTATSTLDNREIANTALNDHPRSDINFILSEIYNPKGIISGPTKPTCTANNAEPVVITCTNVALGNTLTIPGTTCVPTPADTTEIVKCTETVTGAVEFPATATVKDALGITTTSAPIVKPTTPIIPTPPLPQSTPNIIVPSIENIPNAKIVENTTIRTGGTETQYINFSVLILISLLLVKNKKINF